jgi:UDP-glucose 4-epimerase
MNLLAAAGAADSPVRKIVMKSSTLVYGSNYQDPYFFREETPRTRGPQTGIERTLLECESFVRDFAEDNPHVLVTVLRFSNVLGDHMATPFAHALRMPAAPELLGFDPRLQFTHEDDVVNALMYTTTHDVAGIYNVAGDGMVTWSEVCRIMGRPRLPLPPVLAGFAVEPLRALRLLDMPPEMLALLRYGRGVDNSRFKRTGFRYKYTTAGAVDAFARSLRLQRAIGSDGPEYRYERDVETFFRHSPAVVRSRR